MKASELRKIEQMFLCHTDDDSFVPAVVVATLGLGVGLDFISTAVVVHYNCPTSIERLTQEWGRSGRAKSTPKICLTFYSDEELNDLKYVIHSESHLVGASQAVFSAERVAMNGLKLIEDLMKKEELYGDHVRLGSHVSTRL